MFERRARDQRSDPGSEAELVRALAEGSDYAMATLYNLHGGLIYRFCLRMTHDESIAQEVTQDVFLALLRQAKQFDPSRASLSTWLCGVARRMVWKQLERRRRHVPLETLTPDRETESTGDDPITMLSRSEAIAQVQRGIEALTPDAKEVIILCEFEEMTYEQTAIVLEVPVGTVRSRLHRAKSRLALLLRQDPLNTERTML